MKTIYLAQVATIEDKQICISVSEVGEDCQLMDGDIQIDSYQPDLVGSEYIDGEFIKPDEQQN